MGAIRQWADPWTERDLYTEHSIERTVPGPPNRPTWTRLRSPLSAHPSCTIDLTWRETSLLAPALTKSLLHAFLGRTRI